MGKEMVLASSESMKNSLEAIRCGRAGLNLHRKQLLARVPNSGEWVCLNKHTVTVKDIAYLSAATLHEFALLRGKNEDILFHGTRYHCEFTGNLLARLKARKLRLVAHTHPDNGTVTPSAADRRFLKLIGQEKSIIVSYITGIEKEFTSNVFEEIM